MKHNIYIYIMIMAGVSFLIRDIPFTLFRRQIKSTFIKSFLYYVPYVTLAVMTFPAMVESTQSIWSGIIAFAVGLVLAWFNAGLFGVAIAGCASVFIVELILRYMN